MPSSPQREIHGTVASHISTDNNQEEDQWSQLQRRTRNPNEMGSKYCGEGRASFRSDEFVLSSRSPTVHILYDSFRNDVPAARKIQRKGTTASSSAARPACSFWRRCPRRSCFSMERFECHSAAIEDDGADEGESGPLSYFDLPLELIRSGADEACSPVKSAFIFQKDVNGVRIEEVVCINRETREVFDFSYGFISAVVADF
ncbi:hypothetical protein AXF42_Ash010960 [Apostasia shenzhenica]|uniref:Uncharacterized protein n=1 Tax=Apostasia shenzhenica TaxID=1088818 RepID=A0A2H9ZQQ1_9ASPA|nr:hypothetical protein AXF42_Ash010960 [Apostasia shenzhenica]